MQTTAPARLLTRREAAAYLSVSQRKLDQLAADGDLPKIKLGSCARFDRADLDALISSKKSA